MVTYSKTFRDVVVWQRAHAFVLEVYRVTANFPQHELYGLTSQFRRAAVSIAANFVEGFKKRGKPDKLRFYNMAQGSLEECEYYIILASDLEYADMTGLADQLAEVGRLLESYSSAVAASRG
jgi:four helix bundle protein